MDQPVKSGDEIKLIICGGSNDTKQNLLLSLAKLFNVAANPAAESIDVVLPMPSGSPLTVRVFTSRGKVKRFWYPHADCFLMVYSPQEKQSFDSMRDNVS
jgi:hypothetical protein